MTARSIDTDVLVIGSGLAGLLAALELSGNGDGLRVVLACKGPLSESNSTYAQGGVAAVLAGSIDNPQNHLSDTLDSGAGLCHEEASRLIIEDGHALIARLDALGVDFDRNEAGAWSAAREGGHSHARVLHSKDTTGRAITTALVQTLRRQAAQLKGLIILEYAFASELLLCEGTVCGAELLETDSSGITSTYIVKSARTILATGGIGQIFERTTNPFVATGDGIALAFRAGAAIRDPEFVQFHPTALCLPGAPAFLISEAVRGEGAILLDGKGERFMPRFHKDAELTTRDIVARAIHSIIVEQEISAVGLDLRPIGKNLAKRFPNIVAFCQSQGIDPTSQPVPICPAAHYFMGGIVTDLTGGTNVSGLYAIGECASTGLHGANRLASNSLLEAGVMAMRSAADIKAHFTDKLRGISSDQFIGQSLPLPIPEDTIILKSAMYRLAGLVRTGSGLKKLQARIHKGQTLALPRHPVDFEAANMLLLSELIATAAINRTESRGGHFREDYPATKESFRRHQVVSNKGWSWQEHTATASAQLVRL
jgi:L-aspartate oxidase